MIRAIFLALGAVWVLSNSLGEFSMERMFAVGPLFIVGVVGCLVGLLVADLDRKHILAPAGLKERARRAAVTSLIGVGVIAGAVVVANVPSWWASTDRVGSFAAWLVGPGVFIVVVGWVPAVLSCLATGKIIQLAKGVTERLTTWN